MDQKNPSLMGEMTQRALFPAIETFMQIYIDDIVVKFVLGKSHINHLQLSFKRMRRHGPKMTPLKCAFSVQAEDFLSFVVHKKGI